MSRHGRRGAQGEQDGGWELGKYPAADDDGEPQAPDTHARPDPEPMAPERWAPQSWEPPAWQPEAQSWAEQPSDAQAWESESWDEHSAQYGTSPGELPHSGSGDLSPLPPGSLPGPGHPSGPLPPLPPSDRAWQDSPSGPLAPLPTDDAGYDPAPPRRSSRHAAQPAVGYPTGPDGYPTGPDGYPTGPNGYRAGPGGYTAEPDDYRDGPGGYEPEGYLAGSAGYPEEPAGYQAEPAGYPGEPAGYQAEPGRRRGRRSRGEPDPEVGGGYPGYDAYVADPRDSDHDLDAGPDHDPSEYPAAGDWYGDMDESHAWAGDEHGSGLLPGLNEGNGGRRRGGGPPVGASSRKRRRRGRVAILASLMVFVVIVAAAGLVGYHYYSSYYSPPDFSGPGTGTVMVQIKPGDAASVVGTRLASLGVVASARAFSNAAKASPHGNALEPGYYRVHKQMKASLALALLLSPSSRVQAKVTIPEGFRLTQIIATLGKDTGNLTGYQQAIANPAALGLPSFAHGKPEGYLFPATYDIPPNASPVSVLKGMVTQFNQEAVSIGLAAGAAHAQETQDAVITVASIVEAEGKQPADYSKIAEVVYNRLNANPPMNLQLDTTVNYGMSLVHSNAAFSTTFPSPYNTYLHAGLPPGPIDNPGRAAIEAAMHPAHGGFFYFLTINSSTGQTLFFNTAQEFNAAVARYGSTGSGTGSG